MENNRFLEDVVCYRLLIASALLANAAAAQSTDTARTEFTRNVPPCAANAREARAARAHCIDAGASLSQSGRYREAANAFVFAASLDSADVDARYNAGLMLEIMGNHEGALHFFEQAARLSARDPSLHWHIGTNRYQLGAFPGAREALLAAWRLDSTDYQILADLALTEGRMGNAVAACDYWRAVKSGGAMFLAALSKKQRQGYEGFFAALGCGTST